MTQTGTTTSTSGIGDFRIHLQGEFVRRCRQNPQYSLRSFARTLEIEPSALSKLLRGHRGFSKGMILRLGTRLGLNTEQVQEFAPVQRRAAPGSVQEAAPDNTLTEYRQLTGDLFEVMGDWAHYAILEMTRLRGFKPDPRWIARRLCIATPEVEAAVERLQRVGLLEIQASGRWRQITGATTTVGTDFVEARHHFQKRVLDMAKTAIDDVPTDIRSQTTMTMAINVRRLPEARERIKRFRRELSEFLEGGNDLHEVYHLSVSLYPITRKVAQAPTDKEKP